MSVDPLLAHFVDRNPLSSFRDSLTARDQVRFNAFATRAAAAVEKMQTTDPRLLALPHPQRVQLFDFALAESEMVAAFAPDAVLEAKAAGATRFDIVVALVRQNPAFAAALAAGDPKLAPLYDLALRLLVQTGRVRQLQTTDAMDERLRETDIGTDTPANWFRTPYDAVYIEFGSSRSFPISMDHEASGTHRVEGIYLIAGKVRAIEEDAEQPRTRGFDAMIYGSPVGKSGVLDDVFLNMTFAIDDENAPVALVVEREVQRNRQRSGGEKNDEIFSQVIAHAAKILVYMSTADARRTEVRDRSIARARIGGLKSPAKIEKAKRQADRAYDRIIIGPESFPIAAGVNGKGSSPKAHWRRGHFRAQAYGPQMSLRRPVWIEPVLVRADDLGASTRTSYLVRGGKPPDRSIPK